MKIDANITESANATDDNENENEAQETTQKQL